MAAKPVVEMLGAAERAKVVEEFQQRRKQAAANKQRGDTQWMGVQHTPRPLPKAPEQLGKLGNIYVR